MKRLITIIMAIAIITASVNPTTVTAKTKNPAFNKKSITLNMTNKRRNPSVKLKVKNTKAKKIKWKTSNSDVVDIKVIKPHTIKVKAKHCGTTTITCKVGGKKLTCKVTVNNHYKFCKGKHNWVGVWKTIKNEADPLKVENNDYRYTDPCGFFYSEEEAQRHQMPFEGLKANCGVWNKKYKEIGPHGSKAKSNYIVNGTYECIETTFIDYYYCTKCPKRIDNTLFPAW